MYACTVAMISNRSIPACRQPINAPCPRSCLRIEFRETGLFVLSRVSPLILHAQADYCAYSRFLLRRHSPSIPSTAIIDSVCPRFYPVTQMRTDGVHRRESAPTGPVVLKVARETDSYSGNPMDKIMRTRLFPKPLLILLILYYW